MPPKTKIQKEDILDAAITLVRKEGMEGLNARRLSVNLVVRHSQFSVITKQWMI